MAISEKVVLAIHLVQVDPKKCDCGGTFSKPCVYMGCGGYHCDRCELALSEAPRE